MRSRPCNKRMPIAEIRKEEVETLSATRSNKGYMLNCDRDNVLIRHKGEYPMSPFLLLLALERFFYYWSDWLLEVSGVLCLCCEEMTLQ